MTKSIKEQNIMFCSSRNGITIYNKGNISAKSYDYDKIAHINIHRQITYYCDLQKSIIQMIEDYSNSKNPTISASQKEFVFKNKV